MALRIHESIVRGEIDNRVKGTVTGIIRVTGREEHLILELHGNAHPDLAGCLLTFTNPKNPVPHPHLDSLHRQQYGTIGDLTASRKVRVFDIPLKEALAMIRRKETPPEHMANSLYLEWFSEANGRVVIESAFKFRNSVREFDSELLEVTEVADAVFAFMTTSVKLGGALHGLAHGQGYLDDAFTVTLLKRSMGHLQRAQKCLESATVQKLLPESIILETRQEMFVVREEIIRLMDRFRGGG